MLVVKIDELGWKFFEKLPSERAWVVFDLIKRYELHIGVEIFILNIHLRCNQLLNGPKGAITNSDKDDAKWMV